MLPSADRSTAARTVDLDQASTRTAVLRRRRDELQLRLDTAPEQITADHVATLGRDINEIIDYGTGPERKRLCELLIEDLKINLAATTATPTFRIDLNANTAIKAENAPASNLAGAETRSSQGVRERRPGVEMRLRHTNTLAVANGPDLRLPVARERQVSRS